MIKEAESEFWEFLPKFSEEEEAAELDAFEKVIHEYALTLDEFRQYRARHKDVQFIALGLEGPPYGVLADIAEELDLIYYPVAARLFNESSKRFITFTFNTAVIFEAMARFYLSRGYQLVMMLPDSKLFTHPQAKRTKEEVDILISRKLGDFSDQITFVTGLYEKDKSFCPA